MAPTMRLSAALTAAPTQDGCRLRGKPVASAVAQRARLPRNFSPKKAAPALKATVPVGGLPSGMGRCGRTSSTSRRAQSVVVSAVLRELPIFPLSIVALPAADVHLNIFEARYRVLFNTLLSGAEDLEEGLVDHESPFCGTREFGMCYIDENGGLSSIGTLLRIQEHVRLEDGRMQIVNKGLDRFKIVNVKQERPVLICDVEFLEKGDDSHPELVELRDELADLCRNTLRLSYRIGKANADEAQWDLPELRTLGPHDLSCWVAFNFVQDNASKQGLLEMESTLERLEKQRDWLKSNLSYLTAASALESVFDSNESDSGESSP